MKNRQGKDVARRVHESMAPAAPRRVPRLVPALLLAAVTLAVYLPVLQNQFVDYDDDAYLTANPIVRTGISRTSIRWAFTTHLMGNWHPLTWISHLTDIELFGLDPRGHHLMNAAFHSGNTALLFLLLLGLTGVVWPSALAAAFFGLHPLRVESVAWAAERKDVLSTLFWLLASLAYLGYARRPRKGSYALVAGLMLLGLLAKPMLVTLPLAFLLLDWWPLGRLSADFRRGRSATARSGTRAGGLLLEKTPLLILSSAFGAVTYVSQRMEGTIRPADYYPFSIRLGNAIVSYVRYLGQTAWPRGLSIIYLHPRHELPAWKVAAAATLMLAVSAAVIVLRRRPYLALGWFWYLGTMLPVIGLVQVGTGAMSDRYTYVPHIGLSILFAWGLRDLARGLPNIRPALVGLAGAMLSVLAVLTWNQIGHWRDSVSLFRHAVEVTRDNWQGHLNLGMALAKRGLNEEAKAQYREVMRLKPGYARSHDKTASVRAIGGELEAAIAGPEPSRNPAAGEAYRRGTGLFSQGRPAEAVTAFEESLRSDPDDGEARYGLANALARAGRLDAAVAEYDRLLARQPGHWAAHINLGVALARLNRRAEAKEHFLAALRLSPQNADAHGNLGLALLQEGRYEEAIGHFRESLRTRPADTRAMVNCAEALLRTGRPDEAGEWCREALRLEPGNTRARDLLRRIETANR